MNERGELYVLRFSMGALSSLSLSLPLCLSALCPIVLEITRRHWSGAFFAERLFHELKTSEKDEDDIIITFSHSDSKPDKTQLADAVKKWRMYLSALSPHERLQAPFIPRPKLPRASRQKVIDKLSGQHVAMAAVRSGIGDDVEKVVADKELVAGALELATSQELDLYERCPSAQMYSNLAAQTSALHWEEVVSKRNYKRKLEEEKAARQRTGDRVSKSPNKGMGTSEGIDAASSAIPDSSKRPKVTSHIEEVDIFDEAPDSSMDLTKQEKACEQLRRQLRRQIVDLMDEDVACTELIPEERQLVVERCLEQVFQNPNKTFDHGDMHNHLDDIKNLLSHIADDILMRRCKR